MATPQNIVIVGGGLAGAKTAESLIELGVGSGVITVVCAEAHAPYERPPLSKDYLAGSSDFDGAIVHPEEWYAEHGIALRLGTMATSVDAQARRVRLDDGSELAYDRLVLATGSAARRLTIPGADAEGVHYLRTVEESDAIRATFGSGRRLAIVGGGWIGLEVAAAARAAGTEVTVLEASELPLLGVLGPEIAQVFADVHRAHGVDLRVNARTSAIATAGGRAVGVTLEDGTTIDADAVVVGIGVRPEVGLAEDAGVDVDNGVLVDAALRTSAEDIFAVGDIANHDHPVLGHRIRVEHWATALNQPAVAAAALMGGPDEYAELPYFFTDQFEIGMEYIGHVPRDATARVVIRGSLDEREFVAFWLADDDSIIAAMNVNVWDVVDEIKPLIAERRRVDPELLADPAVDYADV